MKSFYCPHISDTEAINVVKQNAQHAERYPNVGTATLKTHMTSVYSKMPGRYINTLIIVHTFCSL